MSELGYGLAKTERIRKRADFVRIQGQGRKVAAEVLLAFSCSGSGAASAAPTQLGVTVSKRVGGAVVRNRVKRLVREAFRRRKHDFPAGLQLVLIAKATAAAADFTQIRCDLGEICRRLSGAR